MITLAFAIGAFLTVPVLAFGVLYIAWRKALPEIQKVETDL
jgi:hypothetical protein